MAMPPKTEAHVGFQAATVRKPTIRSSPLDDAWKNQLSREQLCSGKTLMKPLIFSNGCSYDSRPFSHSFWERLGAWPSEREPQTSLWRGSFFIETADSSLSQRTEYSHRYRRFSQGCGLEPKKVVNGLRRTTCGFDDVPADDRLECFPRRGGRSLT